MPEHDAPVLVVEGRDEALLHEQRPVPARDELGGAVFRAGVACVQPAHELALGRELDERIAVLARLGKQGAAVRRVDAGGELAQLREVAQTRRVGHIGPVFLRPERVEDVDAGALRLIVGVHVGEAEDVKVLECPAVGPDAAAAYEVAFIAGHLPLPVQGDGGLDHRALWYGLCQLTREQSAQVFADL